MRQLKPTICEENGKQFGQKEISCKLAGRLWATQVACTGRTSSSTSVLQRSERQRSQIWSARTCYMTAQMSEKTRTGLLCAGLHSLRTIFWKIETIQIRKIKRKIRPPPTSPAWRYHCQASHLSRLQGLLPSAVGFVGREGQRLHASRQQNILAL